MKASTVKHLLGVPVLLLLLNACSSTPQSNYYLLNAKATEVSTPCHCSIGVGPVTVAEYLNRPQITIAGEPGQLQIEQFQRWGEPLHNNIERVLVENLATLTDSAKVVVHPWRQDQQPRYAVTVNILTMNREENLAVIKVQWQLRDRESGDIIATQLQRYTSPLANPDYRTLAEGFSHALLILSEQIAAQITMP